MGGHAAVTRTGEGVGVKSTPTPIRNEVVEIHIPRDLAVQLVGSDAGKTKRMRPHGAMTKGVAPRETAAVERFMEPFLQQQIQRVENKRAGRPAAHFVARASAEEASALKAFCVRFAESVKQRLVNKGADDRYYRSKQRLEQARAVINQINTALGLRSEDG